MSQLKLQHSETGLGQFNLEKINKKNWKTENKDQVCWGSMQAYLCLLIAHVSRCSDRVDPYVADTPHLLMTDFDAAVHLLNSSQADSLGAPKVSSVVVVVSNYLKENDQL